MQHTKNKVISKNINIFFTGLSERNRWAWNFNSSLFYYVLQLQ